MSGENPEKSSSKLKEWSKNAIKKTAKFPVSITFNTLKGTAKTIVTKANPFDKSIDKNNVSDTGTESIKLAYTSVKKSKNSIKTVNKSIKTTKNTIKTTGKVVKNSTKLVYNTTKFAINTTVAVAKGIGTITVHTVAGLMNPIVIIIIAVFFMILLMLNSLMIIIFAGDNTDKEAKTNAAGLINVSEQYQNGVNFFNTSLGNLQNGFNGLIDSLYYNYDDLSNSELVYMERTIPDSPKTIYQTGFATDSQKQTLKSAWEFSLTQKEIIAIAYVYLEKLENQNNSTTGEIYQVSFTQAVFDEVLSKCVIYSDTVYTDQMCPTQDCMGKIEIIDNPDYAPTLEAYNYSVDIYNSWVEVVDALIYNSNIPNGTAQSMHWVNTVTPLLNTWIVTYNREPDLTNNGEDFLAVLGNEYLVAEENLNNTPTTIEKKTLVCSYAHNLHSIGLSFFSKDDVMNALNFTDTDKQWVELTETGFANNPNIP